MVSEDIDIRIRQAANEVIEEDQHVRLVTIEEMHECLALMQIKHEHDVKMAHRVHDLRSQLLGATVQLDTTAVVNVAHRVLDVDW